MWNRRYVDHVQITVAESLGVEKRGGFYERAGALRDIVQNHVMQVLSLTLMEPPGSIDAQGIRDEKVKALRSVVIPTPDQVLTDVVRAQYDSGWSEGVAVPAYRQEPDVDPHSQTETYVAMKLHVDNWRWAGVPDLHPHREAACPSGSPRSPCSSRACRTWPSTRPRAGICARTPW